MTTRLIGALKLAGGLLLAAAGFEAFRLLGRDLGDEADRFVLRLHLDPENRVVHGAVAWASGVPASRLKAVGAGTFFYALLETVEGVGLLLLKRWAEWLTVAASAALLPLELWEIARKPTAIRLAVLAVNVAVVVYLVWRMWRRRRAALSGPDGGVRMHVPE